MATASQQVVRLESDLAGVPPQSLEAETWVLGAILISANAMAAVVEILQPSDFYKASNGLIYKTALELYAKGEPVDALTVTDHLDKKGELDGVGGRARMHELAAVVPATANVASWAHIVRDMATLRRLIETGQQVSRLGWERPGDTPDLVDQAERLIFELSQQRVTTEFSHLQDLLKESFERITSLYEAGAEITGTPSGFRELDRITSGFQPGNLIILAARPSMGKSAFALCMAANIAVRQSLPVGIFTLEMSKAEVTQRLMCSEAKVESQRLRTGKLAPDDWPRLTAACDKLAKAPIYIDDTGSINMMEVRSKARRLKSRHPDLGLLIVDYLQLMSSAGSAENRVQEVSQISRSLKILARDLEVPIIALSQLSRAVEQRTDKRPILSDLRESGCLAGDTRVYLPDEGVYRPIRDLEGRSGFRVLAVNEGTWELEPRTVTRAFATGRKQVYRLRTRLGREIRATANHKFLAFDGWRRLDDLAPDMRIAVPRSLPGPEVSMGTTGRPIHRLQVATRDDVETFLRTVGGLGSRRSFERTQMVTRLARQRSRATSRDVVPRAACATHVLPAMRAAGMTERGLQIALGTSYRGSTLYQTSLDRERTLRGARAVGSAALATSDVSWDEIVSIEPAGTEDVYDLTVDELHNFVAEDIAVHNSIEQDSDLVAFIYRDEYYNDESDQQGLAEVIVAKHRNGPTDALKLSFLKRYAKFADLAAATS